jgi:hypothetical protein
VQRPAPRAEAPSSAAPDIDGAPAQVEVSWARASRILRELQDHQAPEADLSPPPQLVLPLKYRRSAVPLR